MSNLKTKFAEKALPLAVEIRNFVKEKQLQEFARQGSHMGWFVNNLLYFERPMKEIVNWDL